jgi:ribosome-binding protein aMBF1 (putative translation factor)
MSTGRESNAAHPREEKSMATTYEFGKRDTRYIVKAYRNRSASMADLADEFGVSLPVIRRVLVENRVTIRGRGGHDPK